MIVVSRQLTLLALFLASVAGLGDTPLTEARSSLEKWVETKQLISRTKTDWQSDKEMLEQTAQLLDRELKVVEEQFNRLGTNSTQVEKERLEAESDLKTSDEALERAREFATTFEGQVTNLLPRLPVPLREIIKPLLVRMPSDPASTKMAATERVQVVVAILNELDKFNSAVSVFSEKRKDEKGVELAVDTVYVGLGAAYFVSDTGEFAGTGTAGPKGWEWTTRSEIGSAVREVIRIYRNEHPAKFVALPAVIR